jgi:hypothetical protein
VKRLLLLLLAAACAAQGERARDGCPSGEVCSPDTPNGLFFLGPPVGDELLGRMMPAPVAAGGTQSIRVLIGPGSTSPPFDDDFEALSSNAALGIDDVDPPDVTVHGLAAGQAFLRIVEPSTGLLYDRLGVEVRPVERAIVRPRAHAVPIADVEFTRDRTIDWVGLAGAEVQLLVILESESGVRLVDESIELSFPGPTTREQWDVLTVRAQDGTFTIRTGDGVTRTAAIRAVAAVEDIVSVPGPTPWTTSEPLPAGGVTLCFRATTGGKLVAGADWSFTSTMFTPSPSLSPNCAAVTGAAGQTGTLTVSASGTTRQFPIGFR